MLVKSIITGRKASIMRKQNLCEMLCSWNGIQWQQRGIERQRKDTRQPKDKRTRGYNQVDSNLDS